MANNLTTSADADINFTVTLLKEGAFEQVISSGEDIVPGCRFHFDPNGAQDAHLVSPADAGLTIRVDVQHPGDWAALHFRAGGGDLSDKHVFGFACKSQAPLATTISPCLRSYTEDGFRDTFFAKTIVAYDSPSTHIDILDFSLLPDLPMMASQREFILFFQLKSFELTLHDLRFFVV